ncbi:MAG: ABC transporter substrate-binding protein [Candidatus Aminicenantes bacterium]|nr:MAG: ABC transporter substrate-binding protein [Candidatus Aminicenantes bacterium]
MAKKKRLSLTLFTLFIAFFISCAEEPAGNTEKNILRIGTTRGGFKSASLLGDTFLALFARISNPSLMTMTKDGTLEGRVAARYLVSADCTKWKFYCDPDLCWSDGNKVTAEDAKFSIELLANVVPHARWMQDIINNVFITEENALVIELNRPYSRLDFDFATYNILPKHIWEKIEDPLRHTSSEEIVGCGPFVIARIDLNAGFIRFRKNTHWKGSQPELDGIELQLYSNIDVLAFALEKGDVDTYYRYASSYPYPNIDRLKATKGFDFIEEPHYGLRFLGFNLNKKPMSDIRFREAICYALDYEEIIRLDILGYGEIPSRGFIPPIMPAYKKTADLDYDLEKAKNLLADAGYIDRDGNGFRETPYGKEMKLSILISMDYVRLAELVQDYLESAGINAQIKNVDYNTWISMKDKNNYDLVVSRTSPWGMFMHANWATGYFDARRTGEGVLHNIDDPQFLKLCDNILSTKDEEKLTRYASDVQDYYARNLPAIALYWSRTVIPHQKRFNGWSSNPLYGLYNIQNFLSLRVN